MALSPDLLSGSSTLLCAEDAGDVASWDEDSAADEELHTVCPATVAALVDSHGLASLLAAETHHMPRPDYLSGRSLDAAARHDAVKWILKVSEFYRFRPVTPYLAVNYLDRFLSSHSLPSKETENGGGGGGWPMQLLSVACVSVAAKMEEARVPALLDLQILDPGFVFDPRTVRRMELFLMAALGWRMRAVTPFDFLPHLPTSRTSALLARAVELLLSTLRVMDFLRFRPSSVAAAASSLCAADEAAGFGGDLLRHSDEWANKEVVTGCRQLMEDYFLDSCPPAQPLPPPPPPRSPIAVLDAAAASCGSCDSAARKPPASPAAAQHLRPPKRRRLGAPSRCTEGGSP